MGGYDQYLCTMIAHLKSQLLDLRKNLTAEEHQVFIDMEEKRCKENELHRTLERRCHRVNSVLANNRRFITGGLKQNRVKLSFIIEKKLLPSWHVLEPLLLHLSEFSPRRILNEFSGIRNFRILESIEFPSGSRYHAQSLNVRRLSTALSLQLNSNQASVSAVLSLLLAIKYGHSEVKDWLNLAERKERIDAEGVSESCDIIEKLRRNEDNRAAIMFPALAAEVDKSRMFKDVVRETQRLISTW